MMKQFLIAFFILLTTYAAFPQNIDNELGIDPTQVQVDSILALITPDMPDTTKANLYEAIGKISGSPDTVLKYSQMSLDLCDRNNLKSISYNYDYISWAYYMKGDARKALAYSFKEIQISEKICDKANIANCYVSLAKCYSELNFRDSTFYYFDKALNLYLELKDTAEIAYTYGSIGQVNHELGFNQTAAEYFKKAAELDSISKNYLYLINDYQSLGLVEKDRMMALTYMLKSASLFDSIPNKDNYYYNNLKTGLYLDLATAYMNVAKETGDKPYADSAYLYAQKAKNKFLYVGEYQEYASSCFIIADYLSFCGQNREALNVLLECKQYFDDVNKAKTILAEYYEHLSGIYTTLGDYKNALANYKKMHEYETAYANDSTLNILAAFQTEQAVKIHEVEKRQLASETRRLKTVRTSLLIGLVLVLALVILIFRMFIIKRRANNELSYKNDMLNQQNSEILAQREEIETQRDTIAKQWSEVDTANKKLLDSINYARRIQRAAISSKAETDKIFPQNFVFYRPCDIVSGDFYRVTQCGKYRVLITADCTGHGIPGAFLSMLGISALKEFCATKEDAANPGLILDHMREFIKTTLVSDADFSIDDGMDMTICCFDFEAMELRYAIANQMAILVRDGSTINLTGDRMPVGRYMIEKEHFTTHTIPLMKGDMVFCFSDGIQDQLGGDLKNKIGEKFLRKNLLNLLTANSDKPLETQCQMLEKTISEWSNGRPQVDDMTLIGIRV